MTTAAAKLTKSRNADDVATLAGAFLGFIDTMTRISIERVEAERAAAGRTSGPAVFGREDAAEYLAVGTTTVDNLVKDGEIQRVKIAGIWKHTRKELDRYIAKQERANRHG